MNEITNNVCINLYYAMSGELFNWILLGLALYGLFSLFKDLYNKLKQLQEGGIDDE